ncbi:MAG: YebC/PmpR family DNA-binding transcriptional regulator [Erysipelotrichaceae bacterium]|nr:YebC/PmpR family DNA-binding transcriptional regulator [Erysipelotrichaceae bacterium]
MIPQEYISLDSEEDRNQLNRLLTYLDDVDDVQQVYHNVDNL